MLPLLLLKPFLKLGAILVLVVAVLLAVGSIGPVDLLGLGW